MRREDIVKSWMTTVLRNKSVDNFGDLHVDRIDPSWKNRDHWVEGGLWSFDTAILARDKSSLPVDVALAFSLISGKKPRGVDFKTPAELKARFDWSPPSLYLLHPGKMPWDHKAPDSSHSIDVLPKKIDPSLLGAPDTVKGCWHIEFKQPNSTEFYRTVFLIG